MNRGGFTRLPPGGLGSPSPGFSPPLRSRRGWLGPFLGGLVGPVVGPSGLFRVAGPVRFLWSVFLPVCFPLGPRLGMSPPLASDLKSRTKRIQRESGRTVSRQGGPQVTH